MDRYDLYELAATDPRRTIPFLLAVHAGAPTSLREDFCGSGALARAWASSDPSRTSLAVDLDPEALEALRARLTHDARARVTLRCADVMATTDQADLIAALNFPIGYFHSRSALLAYLRHAHACLRPSGVLVFDTYLGRDAFTPSEVDQDLPGGMVYTWEQREADPLTGRVLNAMHFAPKGRRGPSIRDAFTYDWRLWSVPELRDALEEAGFGAVRVYARLGDAIDSQGRVLLRPAEPDDLDDNDVVYLAARR